MNYNVKLDLSKLKGMKFVKKDDKKYILLDLSEKCYFIGNKGIYLELSVIELKEQKFKQTHLIKENFPKEYYEKLSDSEKNELKIVGNMSPFELKMNENFNEELADFEIDDLPF